MEVWPTIQVKHRKKGEKKRYRLDQERIVIGRDASDFIVLDSRTISRRHAEIWKEGSQHFLKDLKSTHGTLLNEKKLAPQEKILLKPGDLIQIEDYDLIFQLPSSEDIEDPYEATDSDILEIKMVKKLLRAMDRESAPSLEIVEGPQAGERFTLDGKKQEIYIGRDAACEFRIDAEVISRKHARVAKQFDTVTISDLGSKNGTFVNKERIREKTLKDGDKIHLGTVGISFRNPQELSLELFPSRPPEPPKEAAPPPPKEEPPTPPSGPSGGIRATQRRQEKLIEAAEEAERPEALAEGEGIAPNKENRLPEILMILIGLAVLVGSIWAIVKLF